MCPVTDVCSTGLFVSPIEDREEEFEDVKTDRGKAETSNAMTQLTGILASLQVIDDEIDWEDITENLTWGDNDDHLIDDTAEETMQMR